MIQLQNEWIFDEKNFDKEKKNDQEQEEIPWFFDHCTSGSGNPLRSPTSGRIKTLQPFDPIIHFHGDEGRNEILSHYRYRTSSQDKMQYKKDLDSITEEHKKEESERRQRAKYGQHSLEVLVCYSIILLVLD